MTVKRPQRPVTEPARSFNLLPVEGFVVEHHPVGVSFRIDGHKEWLKIQGSIPRPPVGRHISAVIDAHGWVRHIKVRGVLAQRLMDQNRVER